MNEMEARERTRGWRNTIATAALLFFLYEVFRPHENRMWFAISIFLVVYLYMLWARRGKRQQIARLAAAVLLITIVATGHFAAQGQPHYGLLWPLIAFLAMIRRPYEPAARVLVFLTGLEIVIFSYNGLFPYENILAVCGIYLTIRSRGHLRDAFRVIQNQLSELNRAHSELQLAHKELQEASMNSMRYAALSERTRIARDIHDGLGHQLTSLIVQLQALELMLDNKPEAAHEAVGRLLDTARAGMQEVRAAVSEWKEDEGGLGVAALHGLVYQTSANTKLRVHWEADSELSEWAPETAIALYRTLQEALTNILRHAEATEVTVKLAETDSQIHMTIADNGNWREGTLENLELQQVYGAESRNGARSGHDVKSVRYAKNVYNAKAEHGPEEKDGAESGHGAGPAPHATTGSGQRGIAERCAAIGGTARFEQGVPSGLVIKVILPIEPNGPRAGTKAGSGQPS